MRAIITVFKNELDKEEKLLSMLTSLTLDMQQVTDAYVFAPKPGKLFELLNMLREHGISYGTHFHPETQPDPE